MWAKERRFLKENKGWKEPQILGGVTSQGKAKPDFMMYYDAGETTAPINCWAKRIASLLPNFELSKVESPRNGYRGTCILVHSPMLVDGEETSNTEAKFSLETLRDVIHFHSTPAAAEMYKLHDTPQHRMFGSNKVGDFM